MLKKVKWYSFQEILDLYPEYAPLYPHDTSLSATWFLDMLTDADMEPAVYTLSEFFTDEDLENMINALMTIVYYRHSDDYLYKVELEWDESHELDLDDFTKAMKDIVNVIDLTIPKYAPMLEQTEYASTDPIPQLESESRGRSRFNDTPQNEGEFNDEEHATNVSSSISSSKVDSGSLMDRLTSMYKNFRAVIQEWSDEFNKLFFKEEQL